MYCNHYGFSEKPFDVTPDPRFLYLTERHRETLASLIYGIRERRGFIVVIGEVGTGKTTLLNAALDRLDEKTKVAFIFNTDMTFDQILNMALYEWGLTKDKENLSKADAIQCLNRFAVEQLGKGGNVVLIVDEAQNLDNSVMENLRLLSNLETRRHKLIQIVLSGQPELDTTLSRHELRQLTQRISLKRYVYPLDEKGTYLYLQHRLKVAQNSGKFPFTPEAQNLIWEHTNGIPRKINILCDNAFLIGYGLKIKKVTGAVVQEAAKDLKWCSPLGVNPSLDMSPREYSGFTWVETSRPPRHYLKLTAVMAAVGILIFSGGFYLNSKDFQLSKLTRFFGGTNGAFLETVHRVQGKKQVQVSRSGITEHEVLKFKRATQKVPEENSEPGTRAENKNVSYLAEPVKEKKAIQTVVVEKGDTLYRIILKTYGAYDDVILKKVQKQNPKIPDSGLIFSGQIIKLPVDNKMRIISKRVDLNEGSKDSRGQGFE